MRRAYLTLTMNRYLLQIVRKLVNLIVANDTDNSVVDRRMRAIAEEIQSILITHNINEN